jgi:ABC-type nitrate/sulfonate/bicarbonate transport system permease component
MKTALHLAGLAAIVLGLLFAGQGLGYIPWPRTSFMIGQMVWTYAGAGIVVVGIVMIALARR